MIRLIQLWAVIRKEASQIGSDRRMISMLVVMPTIMLLIFGNAVNFDVDNVPTVVVDHDGSAASRGHLQALLADGTLDRVAEVSSESEANAMLDSGEAAAAVIIPPDFDRSRLRGETALVQVVIDGTDPTRAGVASGAAAGYFASAAAKDSAATGALPQLTLTPRVYYNPRLITAIYMVPGTAAMLLISATTLVTAMGFAREREMGTLEQVLVTPISPMVLMVGKTVPYIFVGLFDTALALGAGGWLFGMPMRGNLLVVVVATILFLMTTLGVGLLISTISQTQQQAFMAQMMFVMPANLLSGNMTPIHSMPWWLQPITMANPLRHFIFVLRANLLRGAGFADVWTHLLALFLIGVIVLLIATRRFRKTLS